MLAHETFGLPLPLNITNPYRISLGRFLTYGISAPEGCLEFLREDYYNYWLNEAQEWLRLKGIEGEVIFESAPAIYKFKVHKGVEILSKLKVEDFDNYVKKLTLDYLLKLLSLHKRSDSLFEFIDLLKDELGEDKYNSLKELYPIICLD